ncbi:MAG: DUF1153 domain-containing protein [Hyphomicrobium sp.]
MSAAAEARLANIMSHDAPPRIVRGFDGVPLCLNDLPPPGPGIHWSKYRKANLVLAVQGGLLTREEALRRYAMSEEEFDGWCSRYAQDGPSALCITKREGER